MSFLYVVLSNNASGENEALLNSNPEDVHTDQGAT